MTPYKDFNIWKYHWVTRSLSCKQGTLLVKGSANLNNTRQNIRIWMHKGVYLGNLSWSISSDDQHEIFHHCMILKLYMAKGRFLQNALYFSEHVGEISLGIKTHKLWQGIWAPEKYSCAPHTSHKNYICKSVNKSKLFPGRVYLSTWLNFIFSISYSESTDVCIK